MLDKAAMESLVLTEAVLDSSELRSSAGSANPAKGVSWDATLVTLLARTTNLFVSRFVCLVLDACGAELTPDFCRSRVLLSWLKRDTEVSTEKHG